MFQCKKAASTSFDVAQCDRSYMLALHYKKYDEYFHIRNRLIALGSDEIERDSGTVVPTALQFFIRRAGSPFGSVRKSSLGLTAECGNPEKTYFPSKLFSKKSLSIHGLKYVF